MACPSNAWRSLALIYPRSVDGSTGDRTRGHWGHPRCACFMVTPLHESRLCCFQPRSLSPTPTAPPPRPPQTSLLAHQLRSPPQRPGSWINCTRGRLGLTARCLRGGGTQRPTRQVASRLRRGVQSFPFSRLARSFLGWAAAMGLPSSLLCHGYDEVGYEVCLTVHICWALHSSYARGHIPAPTHPPTRTTSTRRAGGSPASSWRRRQPPRSLAHGPVQLLCRQRPSRPDYCRCLHHHRLRLLPPPSPPLAPLPPPPPPPSPPPTHRGGYPVAGR